MQFQVEFTVVLRGYHPGQVDALLRQVNEAIASGDPVLRETAAAAVRDATFRIVLRGYERSQVDHFLRKLPALLG